MKTIFKKQCILNLIILLVFLISCGKDKNPTGNNGDSIIYPKAEEQNLDSNVLYELKTELGKGTYGDVYSLLIMRNNILVLEEYFGTSPISVRETLQDVQMVTQSITSVLVGIAIHQGKISGIDEKVYNFFPEYSHIFDQDSAKYTITLEHLLTMTAGFLWNEWTSSIWRYDNLSDLALMYNTSDWIAYILGQHMANEPGDRFVYNSGATMLLSMIINKACGLSAEQFAEEYLFEPLGITSWEWETCSKGNPKTGYGLHLRPLDLLKIGQLYLNKGRWNDIQVVPEEWINLSTERLVKDFEANEYIIPANSCDYGYLWWRYSEDHIASSMLKTNDVYFAFGFGDQYIWIIPHLNMVVASTASNLRTFKTYDIIWKYILKAVKD